MAMVLVSSLRGLADADTCNPDTTASTASSSAAAAASHCAAAAASVHGAAAAAAAASAHCTAPAATSTRSGSKVYAGTMRSGVFLVEDIESRQADVRDFLLSEDYRCGVLLRYIASRTE